MLSLLREKTRIGIPGNWGRSSDLLPAKMGNGRPERPLQLIYPLELHCDQETVEQETPPPNPQTQKESGKECSRENQSAR